MNRARGFLRRVIIVLLTNALLICFLFAVMCFIRYDHLIHENSFEELKEILIIASAFFVLYGSASLAIFIIYSVLNYFAKSKIKGIAAFSTVLVCAIIFIYFSFTLPNRPASYEVLMWSLSPIIPASISFLMLNLGNKKNN